MVIEHRVNGDIKTYRSDFQKCDKSVFDKLAFKEDNKNIDQNIETNKNRLCAKTDEISEFYNL